ncbi:hypothetical protein D9615_004470 [Tricholomella constricta]|uniref:Zn(2)-C6 fungal-type domain-containing protein n=1 Tax=Tricholomella constricta TaxID=117010 RepID=A0A8H5HEW9_9AGAR|nr:hypothetical protein D9615_004470 [Tricholomella constricta]
MNTANTSQTDPADIPSAPLRRHVVIKSGSQNYLVPQYLATVTEQKLLTEAEKEKELKKAKTLPGPNKHLDGNCLNLASGSVTIPPDPPMTQRELLGLHAEIKAFQQIHNVTYASAARQLYLAEVAKLQSEQVALNAFRTVRKEIDEPEEDNPDVCILYSRGSRGHAKLVSFESFISATAHILQVLGIGNPELLSELGCGWPAGLYDAGQRSTEVRTSPASHPAAPHPNAYTVLDNDPRSAGQRSAEVRTSPASHPAAPHPNAYTVLDNDPRSAGQRSAEVRTSPASYPAAPHPNAYTVLGVPTDNNPRRSADPPLATPLPPTPTHIQCWTTIRGGPQIPATLPPPPLTALYRPAAGPAGLLGPRWHCSGPAGAVKYATMYCPAGQWDTLHCSVLVGVGIQFGNFLIADPCERHSAPGLGVSRVWRGILGWLCQSMSRYLPSNTLAELKEDWLRWLALPAELHPDERVPVLEDLRTGLRRLHRQAPGPGRVVWEAEGEAKRAIWAVIRRDPVLAARFAVFRPVDLPLEETVPAQPERSTRWDIAPVPLKRKRSRWDVKAVPEGVRSADVVRIGDASGGGVVSPGDGVNVFASDARTLLPLEGSSPPRGGRPPRPQPRPTGRETSSPPRHGELEVATAAALAAEEVGSEEEAHLSASSIGESEVALRRSTRRPSEKSKSVGSVLKPRVEVLVPPLDPKRKRQADADDSAVTPAPKKAKGQRRGAATEERIVLLKKAGWFERGTPCNRCRKQKVACPQNPDHGSCLRCQAQRKGCFSLSGSATAAGAALERPRRRAVSGRVVTDFDEESGTGMALFESEAVPPFPMVKGEHIRGASLRDAAARAERGVVGSEFLHGEHVPLGVRDMLAEAHELLGRDPWVTQSLVNSTDIVGLETLRASRHAVLRTLVTEAHLAAAHVEIARDSLTQVRQRLSDTVAALNEVDDRLEQLYTEARAEEEAAGDDGEVWDGIGGFGVDE